MQLQSYRQSPSPSTEDAAGVDPGASHLTSGELMHLSGALHVELEHLHQRLADNEATFGLLVDDVATDWIGRDEVRRAAGADLRAIRAVNRAIDAMDDGTYGRCAACGMAIPFARLEVLPATRTCVACPEP